MLFLSLTKVVKTTAIFTPVEKKHLVKLLKNEPVMMMQDNALSWTIQLKLIRLPVTADREHYSYRATFSYKIDFSYSTYFTFCKCEAFCTNLHNSQTFTPRWRSFRPCTWWRALLQTTSKTKILPARCCCLLIMYRLACFQNPSCP